MASKSSVSVVTRDTVYIYVYTSCDYTLQPTARTAPSARHHLGPAGTQQTQANHEIPSSSSSGGSGRRRRRRRRRGIRRSAQTLLVVLRIMGEIVIGSWLTALAIEKLAAFFLESTGGVVFSWCKSLQNLTSSIEYRAITGD